MKCPNCGAQIADDSRFCAECGKEIPQGFFCPHCGASMNEGDAFCQNCGKKPTDTEGTAYEGVVKTKKGVKKYLPYILGTFVILGVIGYFSSKDSKGENDSQSAVADTLSVSNGLATENSHSSKEFIMKRLDDVFDDVVKGNIIGSDDGYFTTEFVSLYNQVDKIDESIDGIGFWDGGFWGQQFDEIIKKVEVKDVFDITENNAKAVVVFRVFADGHTMAIPDTLELVYERDDWYIDELHHYKRDMKAYIQSNPQSNTEGNQSENSYSKYFGSWSLYMDSGIKMVRIYKATIRSNMTAEFVTYLPDGSTNGVLNFKKCVFTNGRVYFTDDGDINVKGTPRFILGTNGLQTEDGKDLKKE